MQSFKNIFLSIQKSLRSKCKSRIENNFSSLNYFNDKELLFLHYTLCSVKSQAFEQLNALSHTPTTNYICEEYYWYLIQDSDRLITCFENEIKQRKLTKSYLSFKISNSANTDLSNQAEIFKKEIIRQG